MKKRLFCLGFNVLCREVHTFRPFIFPDNGLFVNIDSVEQ